jgi:Fe-S-cluster containining protein
MTGVFFTTVLSEFECAMCGQCCANQDVIQLTAWELFRLADHLGCPPVELYERHCTIAETSLNIRKHMYIRTTAGRCPFLDGSRCGVHPARPFACRAYPMRVPEAAAGDMKRFVRLKYPMLERSCSLFRLDDDAVLDGDMTLLTDQTIAFAVDEIYFNMITEAAVDLAIPARVASAFMEDAAARAEATEFLQTGGKTPMVRSIGRMAMALQAAAWGAEITFVREPSRITLEHAVKPGNYVLAATGRASVDAVKNLVQSPSLYCKAFSMVSAPGKLLVSAAYAAAERGLAIGFQLELEDASIREMTWNGATPLYIFFVPEDEEAGQAVGLTLNVDQL